MSNEAGAKTVYGVFNLMNQVGLSQDSQPELKYKNARHAEIKRKLMKSKDDGTEMLMDSFNNAFDISKNIKKEK